MKKLLQRLINAAGYRIERLRPPLPGPHAFLLDFVLHVLNQQRGGRVSFVQIGANDGRQEDPCYAWIQRFPWRGVLVEPQPGLAQALRGMYRDGGRIAVEQAVIAARPGIATLHTLRDSPRTPAWASGIASLDRRTIEQHRHKIADFDRLLVAEPVPAMTFDELLEKHAIDALDYLQIDAEGHDHAILQTIDIGRLRPAVIAYEHANLAPEASAACRRLLAGHGYAFAAWLGDTVACLPALCPVSEDRARFMFE